MLEPLGKRPDASMALEEDAGPEIPDGATLCKHDSDCDDGIDCTTDVCEPPGYCRSTNDNSRCSDNLVCNGVESCDANQGGCVSAPPPTCDDGDPCTIDSCDESVKDCVHAPRDFDRDGEADYHCPGGTDCDDLDPDVNTMVNEICGDGVDNDCDGMIDESDCGALPHDTCADPLDITGGGSFELEMVGAKGDYLTSCGSMGASRDVVVSFTLSQAQDVRLQAHGSLPNGDEDVTTLAIQSSCGDMTSEIQCAHGVPGDLGVRALPPGQYFAVVSSTFSANPILLSASFSAPTKAPANMLCKDATDIGTGGHFTGDFIDVGDKIMSDCTIKGQPDVFYKFSIAEQKDVEISAIAGESGMIAVSLHTSCDSTVPDLRCDSGARVLTRLHQLAKGDYLLVLEGPSAQEISYTLDVAITDATPAPQGDTCMNPTMLTLGQSQLVSLAELQNDVSSSCQTSGPDAVLSLHVPTAQDLQVKVDGSGGLVAAALQKQCSMSNSEAQCRTGMPVDARVHAVAAGDYFLVVDSPTAPSLTVEVDTMPLTQTVPVTGNDTCQTAFNIPPDGGSFSGDTRTLNQDYSANCGGGATSKDAAYRLVLTQTKHVIAQISAEFDSVLLRYNTPSGGGAACTSPQPAACNDDIGSGDDAVLDEVLDPGTYYYIVDGFKDSSTGSYTFDVTVTDP